MKKITLLLAIFSLISCKSVDNSIFTINENSELNFYRVTDKSENLFGQDSVVVPKFFEELMFESLPEQLPTESEIKSIEKFYKKIDLNKKSKMEIAEILNEADFPISKATFELGNMCAPVYRDILIFKEKGKVTAFAKICLSCYKNYVILGENQFVNTEIKYEEIHKLLDNLASH